MINKKIKVMSNLISKVNELEQNETVDVVYKGNDFKIDCYMVFNTRKKAFAMSNRSEYGTINSMNIGKITNGFITLFSYDMFGNRNTARIKVADVTLK
jgi:hypothetical protein